MKNPAQWIAKMKTSLQPTFIAMIILVITSPTMGQTTSNIAPISPFDFYGNARATNPNRRNINLFQNNTQRNTLQGYQYRGRRQNRRGGVNPFALPGDRVLQATTPLLSRQRNPGTTRIVNQYPASLQQIYNQYGGFGPRRGEPAIGDALNALTRRQDLILATSLNAPVRRALWQRGTSLSLRTTVEQTPFNDVSDQDDKDMITLDQRLLGQVNYSHQHLRQQAWGWFHDGEYRRSMHAFETAIILESGDLESYIGTLFSHLSLGATQSAFLLLHQLHIRDMNPFQDNLSMTNRFGHEASMRQIQLMVQAWTENNRDNPDFYAMQALVSWYLDDRNGAIVALQNTKNNYTRSPYQDWLTKMQTAISSQHDSPD